MLKLFFLLLAVCALPSHSIQVTNGSSTKYDLSDEEFFSLQNNSLRKGFDSFYRLSNLFIDATFLPKMSLNDVMNIDNQILNITKSGSVTEYISVPQRIYPNLFYFLVSVLVLAVLIPVVGFIFCSYRCCCKKIDLHDRKGDSYKRKFYTAVLFTILMAILICSIVLFFTNMNASRSFRNTKGVVTDVMADLDKFNVNEMPILYQSIETNTDFTSNGTNNLIRDILKEYLDQYIDIISQSGYIQDLSVQAGNVSDLAKSTNNQQVIDAANNMDIKKQLELLKSKLVEQLDTSVIDLKGLSDIIKTSVKSMRAEVDNIVAGLSPNSTNTQEIDDQLNTFVKFYDYLYFALMAVNVIILFIFLLYSMGTIGICARRSSPKKKKCCDRTTHAKLLLSAVGFFILFGLLFLFAAIALLVPGILLRQVVCKPVIEIENSELYRRLQPELKDLIFKSAPQFANQSVLVENLFSLKLATVLRECDQFARSDEMERFALVALKDVQKLIPLDGLLTELPGPTELNQAISKLADELKELNEKVALIAMTDPNPVYGELKSQLDILIGSLQNQLVVDKQSEQFKTLVNDLTDLKTKSINGSISSVLEKTIKNIFQNMPSCKGISDMYKKVVNNVCFEYLDNLNTYWFFLIIIVLLNILISLFAVKQSNHFRKYPSYNQMPETLSPYKEKYMEPTTAIDAYEMNGYHKFNYNYKNQNQEQDEAKVIFKRGTAGSGSTPPPKYF